VPAPVPIACSTARLAASSVRAGAQAPQHFERTQGLTAAHLDGFVTRSGIVHAGGDDGRDIKVGYPMNLVLTQLTDRLGIDHKGLLVCVFFGSRSETKLH